MQPEVHQALAHERRNHLFDLNDPDIKTLWNQTREYIEPSVKPDVDIDRLTETLVISALMFASRDKLSGLSNKERFRVEVEAAMAVAERLNISLTVFGMDVIGFKEINDELGHPLGDEVIKGIGKGLEESTRCTDITISQIKDESPTDDEPNIEVARDGGDEFGAVLLGANFEKAQIIKRRIQAKVPEAVNNRVPQLQQVLGHPLEITIGMAQYDPNTHHSAKDLIKTADDNLTQIRHQNGQPRRS